MQAIEFFEGKPLALILIKVFQCPKILQNSVSCSKKITPILGFFWYKYSVVNRSHL
jgi:hypothetical protein